MFNINSLKAIKIIITIGLWILLALYSARAAEEHSISIAGLMPAIPLVGVLYLLNNFIRSEFIRKIYLAGGFNISRKESFLTVFIASSVNFVIPLKLGSVYRALYLRKKHNIDYSKFASTLLGFSFFAVIASLILTIILMVITGIVYGRWNWYLMISLIILLIFMMVMPKGSLYRISIFENTVIGKFINDTLDNATSIFNQSKLTVYALTAVTCLAISNGLSLFTVFYLVNEDTDFIPVCLLALTQTLAGFLSLTPGAVGIQEAAAAIVYDIVAISPDKIILAVFSIRIIKMITIAILVYPSHHYLYRTDTAA